MTCKEELRESFQPGEGHSLNARQIKANEEAEGRGPRTQTPIRSHCASSHLLLILRFSHPFKYAQPGLHTCVFSCPCVRTDMPSTAEPRALPTGSLLVTPFPQPDTPPPEIWSWGGKKRVRTGLGSLRWHWRSDLS